LQQRCKTDKKTNKKTVELGVSTRSGQFMLGFHAAHLR
jgi:hypothetical protein